MMLDALDLYLFEILGVCLILLGFSIGIECNVKKEVCKKGKHKNA